MRLIFNINTRKCSIFLLCYYQQNSSNVEISGGWRKFFRQSIGGRVKFEGNFTRVEDKMDFMFKLSLIFARFAGIVGFLFF